jgi:SWI/SNF-related matrix-associated actin-dependent regulator of chromatin subfamily A-like protein 1
MPELLPVQIEAIEKIEKAFSENKHKGFILADKMGIGKTATAIELCKKTEGVKLIICPAFLLYNWMDELKMWGVSDKDICVIDSRDQILEEKKVYLVGYSRLAYETFLTPQSKEEKKRPNGITRQLLKKKFDLVVCDEGHYLKAWNSQRSRLILGTYQNTEKNILFNCKNILLLTGTPFLNRIEELYNIVIRIAPKVLGYMTKYAFYQLYAGWIENTGFALVAHGVKNEEDLKKRLSPILLRRTKIEGLAKLTDETIKLDPRSPKLKKLFDCEEKFLTAHGIQPDDIEGITKLTKINVSEIAEIRAQIAISKIPAALELMQDIREEQETSAPVTIYCYHREVLVALKNALTAKHSKLNCAFIDGGVGAKKRHEIVKSQFQTGKLDVLCATIGALREGVNLTNGQDIIFIELDYVPSNINQAIGRFQRRGQLGCVNVRKLVYDAGIEKRIMKILAEKTTTIEKIIGR